MNGHLPLAERRGIALAFALHGICTLPLILLGTLAVSIRRDLDFGTAAQGAASAGLVLIAAAATSAAGRLVDGPRGRWMMSAAGVLTALSLLGAAVCARSLGTFVPFLAVAGIALGVAQPATDAHLHRLVRPERQGTVFSVKQALAGPGVGLLAGLAVPAASAVGGWRGAFILGGLLAAGTALLCAIAGGTRPHARRQPATSAAASTTGRLPNKPLLLLGVAGAVATAPQAAFLAFAVSASVDAGVDASVAGFAFAVSCALAVASRVLLGRRIDRRPVSILGLVVNLLLASVVGYCCFAAGSPVAMMIGLPLLATTAWGWHGLFFLVAVRTSPGAPGRASGVAGTGVLVGAVLGPLLFGWGAEWSYAWSWLLAAACSLAGAGCMLQARRSIVQALGRPVES